MPSLGIVFSVNFWIVLPRALKLAHFSDYFVRQPYIFWRELLRQQRESTTTFCSRRQQAEGLVVIVVVPSGQDVYFRFSQNLRQFSCPRKRERFSQRKTRRAQDR